MFRDELVKLIKQTEQELADYSDEFQILGKNTKASIINVKAMTRRLNDFERLLVLYDNEMGINNSISDLDLCVHTYNCLNRAGITKIYEVARMNDSELMKIKGLGRKSFMELKNKLKERGITNDYNFKPR